MTEELLIGAGSGDFTVDIHPQRAGEFDGNVFLTLRVLSGNRRQSVELKSMGVWVSAKELTDFEEGLAHAKTLTLTDVEGYCVFTLEESEIGTSIEIVARTDEISSDSGTFRFKSTVPAMLFSELRSSFRNFPKWW